MCHVGSINGTIAKLGSSSTRDVGGFSTSSDAVLVEALVYMLGNSVPFPVKGSLHCVESGM